MKPFYNFAIVELKNYSYTLKKKSLLINKPWTLIDEDREIQRLIFKKNNELIISKEGDVIIGTWEYLPEASSIIINRQGKISLFNEGFFTDGILILKKDGFSNNLFILVNQNIIPDLNVEKYLNDLRYEKLSIITEELEGNKNLEIYLNPNEESYAVGNKVLLDYDIPDDGNYYTSKNNLKLRIENSRLMNIYYLNKYLTKDGKTVTIEQAVKYNIYIGDKVLYNDQNLADGKYSLKNAGKILVKGGIVIKRPWF